MSKRPRITRKEVLEGKSPRRRIIIPQPDDRPFRLHQRDLVRKEALKQNDWWFVEHRKGVRRPNVGQDPLEARAVSEQAVVGYLRERIVYKFLVHRLRMNPHVDFSFQSSQQGGRLELGGMVVDFVFPYLMLCIQVQGPQHNEWLREAKDMEQYAILRDMGYSVEYIDIDVIDDEERFEDEMRRIFNLNPVGGGGAGGGALLGIHALEEAPEQVDYGPLYYACLSIRQKLDEYSRRVLV